MITLVAGENELNVNLTPVLPAAQVLGIVWGSAQPFPSNQVQHLTIRMKNLAQRAYTYTLSIFNDGTLVSSATLNFTADQSREHGLNIALGGAGEHSLAVFLSYDGESLDEQYFPYTVAEVEARKDGAIGNWLIWYEGLSSWQDFSSGRAVPVNTVVYVAVQWLNRSEVSARGHIDLLLIVPPGFPQALSATHNQDKSAAPGDGWYVQFSPFTTTEVGTYTLRASLAVDGVEIAGVSERKLTVS